MVCLGSLADDSSHFKCACAPCFCLLSYVSLTRSLQLGSRVSVGLVLHSVWDSQSRPRTWLSSLHLLRSIMIAWFIIQCSVKGVHLLTMCEKDCRAFQEFIVRPQRHRTSYVCTMERRSNFLDEKSWILLEINSFLPVRAPILAILKVQWAVHATVFDSVVIYVDLQGLRRKVPIPTRRDT